VSLPSKTETATCVPTVWLWGFGVLKSGTAKVYCCRTTARMGDYLRAGIPPQYVTKSTRSTQPSIFPGLLNWVPALISWGEGGTAEVKHHLCWVAQVTLCDRTWHVSSRSGEVCLWTAIPVVVRYVYELLYFLFAHAVMMLTCLYVGVYSSETSCGLHQCND